MKLNGSIYYNTISQDNAGVDRAPLERIPYPEASIPPCYRRLWTRRGGGGSLAWPLSHLGPPMPFAHLPWTGPGWRRGWLERAQCPREMERSRVSSCRWEPVWDTTPTCPDSLQFSTEKPLIPGHTVSPSQGSRSPICPLILTFSSVEIHVLHPNPLES